MREPIAYLDSSAIVKRYVEEPGSERVRELYLKAYSGDVTLAYSMWNIGQVLGSWTVDRARRMGRIGSQAYTVARRRFLLEVRRR